MRGRHTKRTIQLSWRQIDAGESFFSMQRILLRIASTDDLRKCLRQNPPL